MKRPIVQLDNQEAISKVLRHQIEKHLKAIGVEVSELKEKMVACARFHNAIEIGRLKFPLHLAQGLDSFGGNSASAECFESNAGFIAAEKAHGSAPFQHRECEVAQQAEGFSEFFLNASNCSGDWLALTGRGTLGQALRR